MDRALPFSPVYIEKGCEDYPITQEILGKIPQSNRIYVRDYKEIFNRPRQDFTIQKNSPKLILAKKKDQFLYRGSSLAPDFGEKNFFYNALLLNCPYNCDYCYLQGMYSSGNIVVFVNLEDYWTATDRYLKELGRVYLCLSYDTDLLAMESWMGYCRRWIEFARTRPNLILELRTKSANGKILEGVVPIPNLILAWTLSPQYVIQNFEKKTASLTARIQSIQKALDWGWEVRICLDPILDFPNWRAAYRELVDQMEESGILGRIREISLGSFRMNKEYFARARKIRKNSEVFCAEFVTEDGASFYPPDTREMMVTEVEAYLHSVASKVYRL